MSLYVQTLAAGAAVAGTAVGSAGAAGGAGGAAGAQPATASRKDNTKIVLINFVILICILLIIFHLDGLFLAKHSSAFECFTLFQYDTVY